MSVNNNNNNNNNSNVDDINHIGVIPFPFATHPSLLLTITTRLATLSPHVHFTFFTAPQSLCKSNLPCNVTLFELAREGHGPKGAGGPLKEIEEFMDAAPVVLRAAVVAAAAQVGRKMRWLMADAFMWFVADLAVEMGVPWVAVWVSGEHSLIVHVYTDLIRQKFGAQGIEERLNETLDFIPGMSKIRIRDLQSGVVTGDLESIIARMLHQMSRVLNRAAVVCITTCEELDPEIIKDLKSKFQNVLTIGPLNLVIPSPKAQDKYNCLGWLDKQEAHSVVYIGLGTSARPSPDEIVGLAEALEASGLKFLWSLKDDLKEQLPKGFLKKNREKCMVIPWAPQLDVLASEAVGVFITHFGYNSVMEGIAATVPMIGRPFFGDHQLNGRLVEAVWEVGVTVEDGTFTKEGILKGLDRILRSNQGKKMRENIERLRQVIMAGVGPNGSSNHNYKALLEIVTTKAAP